jgi:ribosome-associated protein
MATADNTIKLDQFLKWTGVVQTGGEAKMLIQAGEVRVNQQTEVQRGRRLVEGDRVFALGETYTVQLGKQQGSSVE